MIPGGVARRVVFPYRLGVCGACGFGATKTPRWDQGVFRAFLGFLFMWAHEPGQLEFFNKLIFLLFVYQSEYHISHALFEIRFLFDAVEFVSEVIELAGAIWATVTVARD